MHKFLKEALLGLFLFLSSGPCLAKTSLWGSTSEPFKNHWYKFIRYNKSMFGYVSEVDAQTYFLSEQGKSQPEAEFNATIEAFQSGQILHNEPVQCTFPGRYLLFKKYGLLKNTTLDFKKCIEYEKYLNKVQFHSASLLFSSFFINKPASAFGHTLLKLNSGSPLSADLQSYGVDYSAQVTTKNPLLYGILGIAGGFSGRFTLMPFFLKLREYNDYESRDLWELELNFDKSQADLFMAHLWDMNVAYFDYFYFTENCSYHILRLIDAIAPDWDLLKNKRTFIIPVDTLKPFFKNPMTVSAVYYRPSLNKRAEYLMDQLNERQVDFIKKSIEQKKLIATEMDSLEYTQTLDAFIEYLDFKYANKFLLEKSTPFKGLKMSLLRARSKLARSTRSTLNKIKKERMSLGASPRRLQLLASLGEDSGAYFEYRSSLHDIMDEKGDVYGSFSLEMNKFRFFYDRDLEKGYFQSYELAHVFALRPNTSFDTNLSWEFSFGVEDGAERQQKYGLFLNLSLGPSYELGPDCLFYLFVDSKNTHLLQEGPFSQYFLGVKPGLIFNHDSYWLGVSYLKSFNTRGWDESLDQLTVTGQLNLNWMWGLYLKSELNQFKSSSFNEKSNQSNIGFNYYF